MKHATNSCSTLAFGPERTSLVVKGSVLDFDSETRNLPGLGTFRHHQIQGDGWIPHVGETRDVTQAVEQQGNGSILFGVGTVPVVWLGFKGKPNGHHSILEGSNIKPRGTQLVRDVAVGTKGAIRLKK